VNNITIVGAGQIGSRHLQSLKFVKTPLNICVLDPSAESLQIAEERFAAVQSENNHTISFQRVISESPPIDVAIIATNAVFRRQAIENLLDLTKIRYFVLEKLLFTKPIDYREIAQRLNKEGSKAWVNCPMRMMSTYEKIRLELERAPLSYRVTGSQFGLVTNAIHYLDHVAHLTGCNEFKIDTSALDAVPSPSKRRGFLELTGTIAARFADGSYCEITSYASGTAPVVVEIFNSRSRFFIKESEGKLWRSSAVSNWIWAEEDASIPYQSEMTAGVINALLTTADCALTPYFISAEHHLCLLEPLLTHLSRSTGKINTYPFT
jgi:predicted dehydrogenase